MNQKLVSVLIPTYNVEKFIDQAIYSIINQTYKNLEIIIVDDSSKDSTYQKLEKLQKKDKRIRLFKNEKNLKICKTLNRAFNYSRGQYIVRMDGDDICELDRIEKQVKYLEENKEIHLVGMSVKGIDEENREISKNKYCKNFNILKQMLKYGTPVLHIWAARREVYENLHGYREIPYVEDYDFLLRMLTSGYKFTNLEDYYGYSVRFREGNTVTSNGIEQIKAFEYAKKLYLERINNKVNEDSFSEEKFYKYINTNKMEKLKYDKSLIFFKKYLLQKNTKKITGLIFLIQSLLTSKYQAKKILNRARFKFYAKYF
ncbi:glycosyltransferase family 2 protein [Cetobacterium somerae]|uniref:glycosyltransferase family 2 protein n=1 Tax=Cetobacterium somerae TaxID=188913 RepID=UPI003D76870C